MKTHRALPFVILAAMLGVATAGAIQGCGQGANGADMKLADLSTVRDLQGATQDLTTSPDLAVSAKLTAACMTLCQCLVASGSAPDAQTCTSGCTGMSASYYPGSLFGSNMPGAACLDCISGAQCADLFGGSCAAMCP
jgi:hypothetical protein